MKTNKTKITVCLGLVLTFLIFGLLALRGTASSTQEPTPAEQALLDAGIPELPSAEVHREATGSADLEICKSVITDRSVLETREFYETTMGNQGWKYHSIDFGASNCYSNQFLKGDKVFLLSATPAQSNHRRTFIQISYRRGGNNENQGEQYNRIQDVGFQ